MTRFAFQHSDAKVIQAYEVHISTTTEGRIPTIPDAHDRGRCAYDSCEIEERFMRLVTPPKSPIKGHRWLP